MPSKLTLVQQLMLKSFICSFFIMAAVVKFLCVKAGFFPTSLWDQKKNPTCSLNQEQKMDTRIHLLTQTNKKNQIKSFGNQL